MGLARSLNAVTGYQDITWMTLCWRNLLMAAGSSPRPVAVDSAPLLSPLLNGVTELNIDGTSADGSFGFCNRSQESVRYYSLAEDPVVPPDNTVPEPEILAALGMMG
jgi:hypothetical protein